MSDGECRVCKSLEATPNTFPKTYNHEGCVVKSATPVCDSDETTLTTIEKDFSAGFTTTPKCVGCKKDGKSLCSVKNFIQNHGVGMR